MLCYILTHLIIVSTDLLYLLLLLFHKAIEAAQVDLFRARFLKRDYQRCERFEILLTTRYRDGELDPA